jgi:hypothetical protein
MTYTGAEYSLESLFRELKNQVEQENVRTYDQYKDLVDVLIEEKKSYGFLNDEEDLIQIKRNLELRWMEIEELQQA